MEEVMNKLVRVVFSLTFLSFLAFSFVSANQTVTVTQIKGLVQIKKMNDGLWSPAQENASLSSGDQIRSFLESSALLTFPDQSEFILGENSSLDIKDVSQNPNTKASKRELKLNVGTLHYKVKPKEETAAEFKIHSSTSIVGITGPKAS